MLDDIRCLAIRNVKKRILRQEGVLLSVFKNRELGIRGRRHIAGETGGVLDRPYERTES